MLLNNLKSILRGLRRHVGYTAINVVGLADPKLILADEPTGTLDSTNGAQVIELLSEFNEAGTTIVMVTHSPADAEYSARHHPPVRRQGLLRERHRAGVRRPSWGLTRV